MSFERMVEFPDAFDPSDTTAVIERLNEME